jgi:hypothetical protein
VQSTIFDISAETTVANYQRFEPNSSIRILFHLKIPREERIEGHMQKFLGISYLK